MKVIKHIPVLFFLMMLSLRAQPEGGFRSCYTGIMDDSTRFQIDLTIETDRVYGTFSNNITGDDYILNGETSSDGSIRLSAVNDSDSTIGIIQCIISPFRDTINGTWTDNSQKRTHGFQIIKAAEYYLTGNETDFIRAQSSIPQFLNPKPAWQQLNLFLNDNSSEEAFSFVAEQEDRLIINKTNIFLGWEYRTNYLIRYYSDDFVSLLIRKEEYTVSDYPDEWYKSLNFELTAGTFKETNLPELFLSGQNYIAKLSDYIIRDLKAQKADWAANGDLKALSANDLRTFSITPRYIEFSFPPGFAAPEDKGSWFARVPYSAVAGDINPKGILSRFIKYGVDYLNAAPTNINK